MDYFETALPTYLENWPPALLQLTMDHIDLPLSLAQTRALASNIRDLGQSFGRSNPTTLHRLMKKLHRHIQSFPEGAFIRLGSNSPKDSPVARRLGLRCTAGAHAVSLLTDQSGSMGDDLYLSLSRKYAPHIFIRRWRTIEPWAEFRCFMRDRQLVGISQYHCNLGPFPLIHRIRHSLQKAIHDFFYIRFLPSCHLSNVVFDIFAHHPLHGPLRDTAFSYLKLIDLNPFCDSTDPCLFSWQDEGSFDGSFRYLTGTSEHTSLVIHPSTPTLSLTLPSFFVPGEHRRGVPEH